MTEKHTDIELLEMAAKAVRLNIKAHRVDIDDKFTHLVVGMKGTRERINWNPLADDGDALRLAVMLGMKLSTNLHHRFVTVNDEQEFYDEAKFGGVCDPEGVMRRTIVRVACEIGRSMK